MLDTQQLIVFGNAVGAAERAGLDLAGVGGDGDVRNGGIFGFAGAMADDGGVTIFLSEFHGVQGFGQGTDLIHFDEDGVGGAGFDAAPEEFDVRDEEVVTDELDTVTEFVRQGLPVLPIAFGAAVFDANDGVLFA